MKVQNRTPKTRAFTLIEMIGVLAVIAILAALLIPKIFEAINNARVNNAAISCQTVKTAIADHYAKYGSIPVDGSGATPLPLTVPFVQYDKVLLKEGFLDKPFAVKIGDGTTNTIVQLVPAVATNTAAGPGTGAYNLDGDTTTTFPNDAPGSVVVEAVIVGVTANDAKDFNDRVDGPSLGAALTVADNLGRVVYAAYPAGTATNAVYVYLTHR